MSPNDSEQGQHPGTDNKARKLKYWGLGLVVLGLGLQVVFAIDAPIFTVAGGVFWHLKVGIGISGVGLACYAKSKGRSIAWCLGALLPFVGPLIALKGIVDEGKRIDKGVRLRQSKRIWSAVGIVIILVVLAAIAIPLPKLTYNEKARQSQAKAGLDGMFTAAMALKEKTKTFVVSDIKQLGYVPAGTPGYSYWYSVNGVPTAINTAQPHGRGCDVTTPPTTVQVAASATGFTAAAKGNIDDDATCDEWSINDARQPVNTLNDVNQ
jgi:hypothetical protein